MKTLDSEKYQAACTFINTHARSLERTLFALHFGSGNVQMVTNELAAYQNNDGGFWGLEPDLCTPTSSALATEHGLRLLAEAGCTAEHPLLQKAVQYLYRTFEPSSGVWRIVPLDVNEYPHAPWWHDEEGSLAGGFNHFLLNPRPGILALLLRYESLVPADWLNQLIDATVETILNQDAKYFADGGDALVSSLRLAQSPGLPEHHRRKLAKRLLELVDAVVSRKPEEWSSYCAPPLKLAPMPDSLAADLLKTEVQTNLDYLIETQSTSGCWEPNWNWAGFYPEAWEKAKVAWQGMLTLDALRMLSAHGRISQG